jgi:TM2 domain-containing membrane protein YozV
MTVAGFGRKGLTGAAPVRRRAPVFGQAAQAAAPLAPEDEIALRREAFLAQERARSGAATGPAPTPAEARAQSKTIEALAAALRPRPPETFAGKSYAVAFLLWMLLGIAGAHRLYLDRPISGGIQAAAFVVSLGLLAAGYYPAFLGLVFCTFWMLIDARLIGRMSRAREK